MSKHAVKANPARWSEKSQRSVSAEWTTEYTDIQYFCWRCGNQAIFTAGDQQRSFEVKKNHIDQRRILCSPCWSAANDIRRQASACEDQWLTSKTALKKDAGFLSNWLELLTRLEAYVPYKPDTAKKNMLFKLLKQYAQQGVQGPTSPPSAETRP